MAKKVAVYFTDPNFDGYPFDEEEYRLGYHKFGELFEEKGVEFYVVRGQEAYIGGNKFRRGWIYKNGKFERVPEEIEVDVIFNKGILKVDKKANIVAEVKLDEICTNKLKTYEQFKKLCPKTIYVTNEKEFEKALDEIDSELIVAKPLDAFGGAGVVIGSKAKLKKKVKNFPYLVQEFIDTSKGIPGIVKGLHDFRLVVVKGEVVSTLLRMPQTDSYVSNVSQGGTFKVVPLEKVPESAYEIFKIVDAKFKKFPHRLYSIDMGFHKGKEWKLIELNCQPGFSIDDYNEGETGHQLFDKVVDLLIEA